MFEVGKNVSFIGKIIVKERVRNIYKYSWFLMIGVKKWFKKLVF